MDADAPDGGVDDMTKLAYLHKPGVLANLSTRYRLDEIDVSPELRVSFSRRSRRTGFGMPAHCNR